MKQHRGEIAAQRIKESQISLISIYTRLGIAQNTLTNWLEKEDLGFDKILQIGELIGYDFSKDFPDLKNLRYDSATSRIYSLSEPDETYKTALDEKFMAINKRLDRHEEEIKKLKK